MFPKTIKSGYLTFWFFISFVFFFPIKGETGPRMRLDLEKETQRKVSLAITDFVFKGGGSDIRGMGKEAKRILEKDLVLSELFSLLTRPVFDVLETIEGTDASVEYRSWRHVGAQWVIKTE
ncbi:MAG: hypothetical protein F3743_10370, partial [Nitrospinae bacterium]|nr:hypothetical protein [Nitrospinota bacterium]